MRTTRRAVPLLALVLLAACGTSNPRQNGTNRNPNLITLDEIERERSFTDAYTAVEHLRPLWLRKRGNHRFAGPDEIVVYVDGSRMGGPQELRYVSTSIVRQIKYMPAREANLRYGAGHTHGAILLSTRNGSHLRPPGR